MTKGFTLEPGVHKLGSVLIRGAHDHRAILTDHPEGVYVEVWWRTRLVHRTVLDCPWHVACDRVHEVMRTVKEEEKIWRRRRY